MEKLKLFRLYDVECEGNIVVSVKKELIAEVENEEEALDYVEDREELYLMRFDENDTLLGIACMVYGGCDIDEDSDMHEEFHGHISAWTDVAEWDCRVIASVAFDTDFRSSLDVKR